MFERKIFIAHGGSEFSWAERFFCHLASRGVAAFLAPEEFPYGDHDGANAMKGALASSDVLIALITAESAKSVALNLEIGGAVALRKPIVLVVPRGFDDERLPLFTRNVPQIVKDTPEKTAEALLSRAA